MNIQCVYVYSQRIIHTMSSAGKATCPLTSSTSSMLCPASPRMLCMALQAASGNIWHKVYNSLQREKSRKKQSRNEEISLVSRAKYLNQDVNLRKKKTFLNSRYELIYGGEFRWTPGGQFSNVLQQKAKQFLRQTEISFKVHTSLNAN